MQACKLFWSRFQMFLRNIYPEDDNSLFSLEFKQDFAVGVLLVIYCIFNFYMFGLHTTQRSDVGGNRAITRKNRNHEVP